MADGSDIQAVNGLTVGVIEDNNVVEYVFKNVPANPTASNVTVNNLFLKQVAVQEETDPTVPAWAKQEKKPSYTASEVGAIPDGDKGVAGGVATLGSDGKVPQSQLPSYVDDVLEYSNQSSFPATGESGKIYVALDTNKTYRWSGSAYVEISQSLALGETSSTAFAGDRGKAIEDKIPSGASSSNKLATVSDLNGKVDKVANAQENNFASFDANGGIKDSTYKATDFATAAQGTKADNAIPMPSGTDGQILEKDSNETSGVKWVQKPQDGKSALQIYNETYGTNLNEAQFINVLKQSYPMEYVAYDSSAAGQSIGTGFQTIGSLMADSTTAGKMYLMPNATTAPTGTILFVTVQTGASTYAWYKLGDLDVPSNVLTEDDIDNTHLVNPKDGSLPTANDAMQLKAKLEGVTASETKVQLVTSGEGQNVYDGFINGSTGTYSQSIYNNFVVVPLNGAKRVRFLAKENSSNTSKLGWSFGSFSGAIDATLSNFNPISYGVFETNPLDNQAVEYVKYAHNDATHVCITIWKYPEATSAVTLSNFYCYLQSGESVVELIDNLDKKTNGEDYEVESEILPTSRNTQWIICKSDISYNDTALSYTNGNDSFYINLTQYRGTNIKITGHTSYYSYYMVLKKLPEAQSAPYTFQQLIDGGFLCEEIHHTENNWKPTIAITTGSTVEVVVPNNALAIILTGLLIGEDFTRNVSSVKSIKIEHTNGNVDNIKNELQQQIDANKQDIEELKDVEEQVDTLIDDLYGELQDVEKDALTFSTVRKGSLDANSFTPNPTGNYYIWEIPLENAISAHIVSRGEWNHIFVSKSKLPTNGDYIRAATMRSQYMATCEGFNPEYPNYLILLSSLPDNPNYVIDLTFNSDCKYLYCYEKAGGTNRTPESITIVTKERVGGVIAELSKGESNQGEPIKLIIKDGKCFTTPIHLTQGFYLRVKEQYKLTNAYLVDHLTGEVVDEHFPVNVHLGDDFINRFASNMSHVPAFDVIYQIENVDDSDIVSDKGVIDSFALVEDICKRKLPEGISTSIYGAFKKKVQTSIGSVWTPSLQAARKIPRSGMNADTNRYLRGVPYIGVNYSGPTEWGKHVGLEVSMRTFITAINNPRSVMYTEMIDSRYGAYDPNNPYGFTHNSFQGEAGAYYGCVCTGLTSYLLGLNSVIPSSAWKVSGTSWGSGMFDVVMQGTTSEPTIISAGENTYSYNNVEDCKVLAEMLQPMDFIWNSGHCAVISDIYTDEWGDVMYIVISEQTAPNSVATAYSPKDFFERYGYFASHSKDWQVLRKKTALTIDEAKVPRIGQDEEFVVMNSSQYNSEDMGKVDKDITTFAGEGAVFVIGDYSNSTNNFKMFLNIHRGGSDGYNYIQLFNESDDEATVTPIDEIDVSSNGGNVAQSDILDADAATEEDWIIYNLAEYWRINQPNNTGKFKVRVVRKESSSVVLYSECTYFEFVKIEVSIDTTNNKFGFVVKGGIPMQYRIESANGLISGSVKDLTSSDYSTVDDVHTGTNLTIPSSWNSGYIRLLVKTDYGMANRRIAYTKPTN